MKRPKGYSKFDAADYLNTETEIQLFLDAAMESNDPAHIATALGVAARARGMTKLAKQTGLTRSALYHSLSQKGNPEFATILKILSAFGFRLKLAQG